MISKKFLWSFILRVLLLTAVTGAGAVAVVHQRYQHLFILVPFMCYLWYRFYRYQVLAHTEVEEFAESVKYHDFSRHFSERAVPPDWRPMRRSFNEVFNVIKGISKDNEKHYQYLHKILELVDTGIISYEVESGHVVWINESLKKLFRIPNLKLIDGLSKRHPELYREILAVDAGKQSIATIEVDRSMLKILLAATVFHSEGRTYKVIAIQDVQEALDETESRAWQKLLSVLTHEIMNSVAPISSVAKTLNDLMLSNISAEKEQWPVDDIRTGLDTIKRRSEGLLRFSETYRNLSKITSLNINTISVHDLFEGLILLMQPSMQQKKISLQTQFESEDLMIRADANLAEQVLINLLMNAMEAVKDRQNGKILLTAKRDVHDKVLVSVADNGTGIPPELMDNIFIPFFSTRKNGTGIGLSLCKQIMLLHKGNIQVRSIEGTGSTFILQFAQ